MICALPSERTSFFSRFFPPGSPDSRQIEARQSRSGLARALLAAAFLQGAAAHGAGTFPAGPTNIDSTSDPRQISLAVDQSSAAHAAYYDDGGPATGWVLYSSKTAGGTWNSPKRVGKGIRPGTNPCGAINCDPSGVSLALGADGSAFVAFFSTQSPSSSNNALWYAKMRTADGVVLSSAVVDSWTGSSLYAYTSIALDGAGNPHVAYSSGGVLGYARFDGIANSWIKQTPDSSAQVNLGGFDITGTFSNDAASVQQLSLALDATGYGHIAYYDGASQQLKYVSSNGAVWGSPEVIDPGKTLPGNAVVYSASSTAVISRSSHSLTVSWANPNVANSFFQTNSGYAIRYGLGPSDGSCNLSGVSFSVLSSKLTSPTTIVLLSSAAVYTLQICNLNMNPVSACDNFIVSSTTAGGAPIDNSPPFKSCGGASGVSGTSDTIVGVSLALDGAGAPQVSYMDDNPPTVSHNNPVYRAKKSGSWAIDTVNIAGLNEAPYLQTSLALDGAGNPSVAVGDFSGVGAWYTWLAGTWQAPVSAPNIQAYALSLTLDASGNPRLAASDSVDYSSLATNFPQYSEGTGFNFAAPMGGSPRGKVMAPDKLTASSASNTSITWTWRSNSGGNESNFQLFEPLDGITSTGPFHAVATIAKGTTFYTQTGLTAQTTYFAYVAAVNAGGLVTSSGTAVLANTPCTSGIGISVDVSTYDFTSVTMGATTISTRAVVVTNTGGTCNTETYSLSAATATLPSSVWSLAVSSIQAAGPDRALLEGAFSANSRPASASFDNFANAISTTAAAASSGAYTVDGITTGTLVPSAAARYLWFKLVVPTATTYVSPPQQTITVTVTAGSP